MAKEYEQKIAVVNIDNAPAGDSLIDDLTNVVAWSVNTESMAAAITADSAHAFSGSKCAKLTYTATGITDYVTFTREYPFIAQTHTNFEFAIGRDSAGTRGDISFAIGHRNNADAVSFMKFKILDFGFNPSTLQYWRASDNTWVTLTTIAWAGYQQPNFVIISGKFNTGTGRFEVLRVGAQRFNFVEIPLEGELTALFQDNFTTPSKNSGMFGIEITNCAAASAKTLYIDRVRIFGSSI